MIENTSPRVERFMLYYMLLDFTTAAQTINPIKKGRICVPKTNNTNEIIISNNMTKQPDDIGQLVTSYSCDMLQTAPPSQTHAIEIILFR